MLTAWAMTAALFAGPPAASGWIVLPFPVPQAVVGFWVIEAVNDHHANPLRRYQVLRTFDVSPQLPAGYATMLVLALIPPLWRRVMDPRVLAHHGGVAGLANRGP